MNNEVKEAGLVDERNLNMLQSSTRAAISVQIKVIGSNIVFTVRSFYENKLQYFVLHTFTDLFPRSPTSLSPGDLTNVATAH